MKEVGASEAKTRLGSFSIWSRPAGRAAARIRAMRKGVTLGRLAIRDLVGEDRL
jgi:hypothetical protein